MPLSIQEFIQRSKEIHQNKYDYSHVNCIDGENKVKIICSIHGIFLQSPKYHLTGSGCQKCSIENRYPIQNISTEMFIEKVKEIHNNKYDYSKTEYTKAHNKIIIICPEHGEFLQSADNHLRRKSGCSLCVKNKALSKNEYIKKVDRRHNGRYDYSLATINGLHNKISIICKDHGIFEQEAASHLRGTGCPKCMAGFSISKPEMIWLDSLKIPEEYRQRTIKVDGKNFRVDAYDPNTNTVYEFWGDYWHGNPKLYDKNGINGRNNKSFGQLYEETQNKRNIILNAGYKLVEIWEYDFYLQELLREIFKTMKSTEENIRRLKQLVDDGVSILRECSDLKEGLNDTIKSVAEEMEIKPAIITKFIKDIHNNKTNDRRSDNEILEELHRITGKE